MIIFLICILILQVFLLFVAKFDPFDHGRYWVYSYLLVTLLLVVLANFGVNLTPDCGCTLKSPNYFVATCIVIFSPLMGLLAFLLYVIIKYIVVDSCKLLDKLFKLNSYRNSFEYRSKEFFDSLTDHF